MKKSILTLPIFLLFLLTMFTSASKAQTWAWAKSAGGMTKVESYAIAIDKWGNSYITGYFEDSIRFGPVTLHNTGNAYSSDIFLAKYDVNGAFVWAQKAGGAQYDYGTGLVTDSIGDVFVTGLFESSATFGTLPAISSSGSFDVFIAKYDTNGNAIWVKKGGGTGWEYGNGIAIDNRGNCIITGSFLGSATFGTTTLTSSGSNDAFVAKYNGNGGFLWAKRAGGTGDDKSLAVTTDPIGNSYITGYFSGTVSFGTSTITSAGGFDMFFAKFDANGNAVFAKKGGGSLEDEGKSIKADSKGGCFVTGYYNGTATFGISTTVTSAGMADIFTARYDYKGDLIWVKSFGSPHDDKGYAICIDSIENSYFAGSFFNTAQFDTITAVSANQDDAFICALDSNGRAKWVRHGGGLNPDVATGLAVNSAGDCYTTGYFSLSADFGTHNITGWADNDAFTAKLARVVIPQGISEIGGNLNHVVFYPNPFNSVVTIELGLNSSSLPVSVELFDIRGREVTALAEISKVKNLYDTKQLTISRGGLTEGLYFGKISQGDKTSVIRLMLIK